MGTTAWIVVVVVGLLAFAGYWYVRNRGGNFDWSDPRHAQDRADPVRAWAQGAMAVYRGDMGDPAYWDRGSIMLQLRKGWSVEDVDDLMDLIERYEEGEINLAFDKLRLIWLARVGHGAGWIPEAHSWEICARAVQSLRAGYQSWDELAEQCRVGAVEWYGEDNEALPQRLTDLEEAYEFARTRMLPGIPYRT
jgi:hypothetical protein